MSRAFSYMVSVHFEFASSTLCLNVVHRTLYTMYVQPKQPLALLVRHPLTRDDAKGFKGEAYFVTSIAHTYAVRNRQLQLVYTCRHRKLAQARYLHLLHLFD